ncbi:PAAR domain-containing protein [Geofilum rhodophaeum]|uniref:PAAR domain-containing protein n=1 Tax=Geofilum rhodophaeum TaxID=1965019 RepID=UPI000B51F42C|nr:PAAR domain-containing protein [Geofilum rhodophaeum]
MPGPAATVGSMHVCPMLNPGTPPPPHVGGPVSGPGVPTVLIGGKPAAVMGDMCVCAGPPDTIVQGEATVLIGGKPAATVGCMTAHGGSITVGEPTVLIGTGCSGATAITPVKRIPFPKISPLLKAVAAVSGRGASLKEAEANQKKLKEEAEQCEGEPRIYNVRWVKENTNIINSKELKEVEIVASVMNIEDGENIDFSIERKQANGEIIKKDLSGKVENGEVRVSWQIEKEE